MRSVIKWWAPVLLPSIVVLGVISVVYLGGGFRDTEYRDVPGIELIALRPEAFTRFTLEFPNWGQHPPGCWEVLVEHRFERWVSPLDAVMSSPTMCITMIRIEKPK